jgi:hypothetical protein
MGKNKLFLTAILILAISILNGQSITSHDLVGPWLFGKDKNPIEAEFKKDSTFIFYDSITIGGKYSISKTNDEYLLTLDINSGQYAWKRQTYLIRMLKNGDFKLEIPKKNKNGEIVYLWPKHAKENIYILSRIDTGKPKEPVQ